MICFQTLFWWSLNTTYLDERFEVFSCDLLSNFILMIFEYNSYAPYRTGACVVICFQTLFWWSLNTTKEAYNIIRRLLWFAFKLYSDDLWIQLFQKIIIWFFGCDLLSNFILMIFEYNTSTGNYYSWRLWFAFKLYSDDLWIQPVTFGTSAAISCDLLSNFILMIFEYNKLVF